MRSVFVMTWKLTFLEIIPNKNGSVSARLAAKVTEMRLLCRPFAFISICSGKSRPEASPAVSETNLIGVH